MEKEKHKSLICACAEAYNEFNKKTNDIIVVEQFILKLNDAKISNLFACTVPCADMDAHEKIIRKSGNERVILSFEEFKNNMNTESIKHKALIESCVESYNEFGKTNEDISNIEAFILKLNNPKSSTLFATTVPCANIKAHGEVVAKLGSAYENLIFAEMDGADKIAHEDAITKANDKKIISALNKFKIEHDTNVNEDIKVQKIINVNNESSMNETLQNFSKK